MNIFIGFLGVHLSGAGVFFLTCRIACMLVAMKIIHP